MGYLEAAEHDLHAFIDGQLAAERQREVMVYLDVHPEEADRVADYLHQRADLILLGRCLAEEPTTARPAGSEAALLDAMRRQKRARRTIAAVGATTLAAAVGWGGWLASGRLVQLAERREGHLTPLAGEPS
jgi:anti-sigma factor RsiW